MPIFLLSANLIIIEFFLVIIANCGFNLLGGLFNHDILSLHPMRDQIVLKVVSLIIKVMIKLQDFYFEY